MVIPPKLVAFVTSSVSRRNLSAAASPPRSTKLTTGPKLRICRTAISYPAWLFSPGYITRETPGRPSSHSATASAFAVLRSSRSASVASDRVASHASIGPGPPPVKFRHCSSFACQASSVTATCPISTSLCPVISLVSDTTEKSAPSASTLCPIGVAVVLSHATSTPAACARSHSAAISHTSIPGLLGDSIHSSRAPASNPSCISSSTRHSRTSTPMPAKYASASIRAVKYPAAGSTTASPGPSTVPNTAIVAAIPDPKHSARAVFAPGSPSPVSITASTRSSVVQFGCSYRA